VRRFVCHDHLRCIEPGYIHRSDDSWNFAQVFPDFRETPPRPPSPPRVDLSDVNAGFFALYGHLTRIEVYPRWSFRLPGPGAVSAQKRACFGRSFGISFRQLYVQSHAAPFETGFMECDVADDETSAVRILQV